MTTRMPQGRSSERSNSLATSISSRQRCLIPPNQPYRSGSSINGNFRRYFDATEVVGDGLRANARLQGATWQWLHCWRLPLPSVATAGHPTVLGILQGDRGDAVPVQESLPLVQLASFFAELFGQGQWALDAEAVEQPAVLTLLLGELQQPGQYGCRRFPVIASQPQGRAA